MTLDEKMLKAFSELEYPDKNMKHPKIGPKVNLNKLVGGITQEVKHLLIHLVENIPRDSTDAFYTGPCYVFKDRVIMRSPAMFIIHSDLGLRVEGQDTEFIETVDYHTMEFELGLITEAYQLIP